MAEPRNDYALHALAANLQVAYDDMHESRILNLTDRARKNNYDLALLTECLPGLYKAMKDNPDGPHDLSEMEPIIQGVRRIYEDMKEIYAEEMEKHPDEFRFEKSPFPENLEEVSPDMLESITQKLESLRQRKQNELPEFMTEMQRHGQLLLAIVEITKNMVKIVTDGNEYANRKIPS